MIMIMILAVAASKIISTAQLKELSPTLNDVSWKVWTVVRRLADTVINTQAN